MAVTDSTAHEFIAAMSRKDVDALIAVSLKIALECDEIWQRIDYHNKESVLGSWKKHGAKEIRQKPKYKQNNLLY